MYYRGVVYPHVQYHCNAPRVICTILELYIHMYNIIVLHHGSYVLSWSCIVDIQLHDSTYDPWCNTLILYMWIYNSTIVHMTRGVYCTTGHMYYRGVVDPHVQYQCIAPRVICTIVELYIHMYNIIVLHHGSYVLSWSWLQDSTYDPWCNTLILYMWIYNSKIVHMTRGAIHWYCTCGYTTPR
jgi:hypothetical protein